MVEMSLEEVTECVTVPSWASTVLVQATLQGVGIGIGDVGGGGGGGGADGARVARVSFSAAAAPGDSYCSALFRATAEPEGDQGHGGGDGGRGNAGGRGGGSGGGEGGTRSVLLKGPPAGAAAAAAVAQGGHFRRETLMLTRLVPKMEALLEAAAPGRFPPFAARCPLHGSSPVDFLVLQDLQPLGFQLPQRKRGLGLRHCLIAMRTLARYHAASAALLASEPGVARALGNPMRPEGPGTFRPFVDASVRLAAGACRSWPGFREYADFLDALRPGALETFAALLDRKPGQFNVIAHGDFWVNNVMFRYEHGRPVDMRMVDFQISCVASPAIDLLYFFSTSPSEDVSSRHEDLLLREYHVALRDTLELLGLQAPPLESLQAALDAHGPFALFGATGVVPLVKVDAAPDVNATAGGDADANADAGAFMYEQPAVKAWLQRVLPEYKRRGWLWL